MYRVQVDLYHRFTAQQSSVYNSNSSVDDSNNGAGSDLKEIATHPTAARHLQAAANTSLPRRRQISQLSQLAQLSSAQTQQLAVKSFNSIVRQLLHPSSSRLMNAGCF